MNQWKRQCTDLHKQICNKTRATASNLVSIMYRFTQKMCTDDFVTVEQVVETPKSVKTSFDIEITEATDVG